MNAENKNIVLYVRGNKVYEGDIWDVDEVFEKLCENDKAIYDMFIRYCNSFGDDILEEGDSPREVANATWVCMKDYYDYFDGGYDDYGYSFGTDFDADYHYNDPQVECFMAFEEIQEEEAKEMADANEYEFYEDGTLV